MSNPVARFLPLLVIPTLAALVLVACEQTPPACTGSICAASPSATVETSTPLPPEYHAVPSGLDPLRPQPTMDALSASRSQERVPISPALDRPAPQ